MIRQVVLLFLFVVFLIPSAFAFKPQENRAYKYLGSLDSKSGFLAVSKFLNSAEAKKYISKPEDMISFGIWLRDTHLNPQKDLRYGFLYAQHMKKLSEQSSSAQAVANEYQGTASLAYFVSHLKLMNAINRCDDKNAGMKARMAWSPSPSEYKKLFTSVPEGAKEKYVESIFRHAENSVDSNPVDWVCLDGISVMNRAMQAGEEAKKTYDPSQIGDAYIIDTSKYVEFISDKEWKKKREENAEKLRSYLLDK